MRIPPPAIRRGVLGRGFRAVCRPPAVDLRRVLRAARRSADRHPGCRPVRPDSRPVDGRRRRARVHRGMGGVDLHGARGSSGVRRSDRVNVRRLQRPEHDEDPVDEGYVGADGLHPSAEGNAAQVVVLDALGYDPITPSPDAGPPPSALGGYTSTTFTERGNPAAVDADGPCGVLPRGRRSRRSSAVSTGKPGPPGGRPMGSPGGRARWMLLPTGGLGGSGRGDRPLRRGVVEDLGRRRRAPGRLRVVAAPDGTSGRRGEATREESPDTTAPPGRCGMPRLTSSAASALTASWTSGPTGRSGCS